MSATALALEFVETLDECDDAARIGDAFTDLIAKFGFDYFCIGTIKSDPVKYGRGTVWAHTPNSELFRRWINPELVRNDPGVDRLRQLMDPFRWSKLKSGNDARWDFMLNVASDFGMQDGWAGGFRTSAQERAVWTLGTSERDLCVEDEAALHLASVYCSLTLMRIGGAAPALRGPLSARERECLTWVAAGKTDWEISCILNISQKTAHEHMRNALAKLNASTRAHAVAIAITKGLLAL